MASSVGDRIRVLARVRPLTETEVARRAVPCVRVLANGVSLAVEGPGGGGGVGPGSGGVGGGQFRVDRVLGEGTSQSDVFRDVLPLLQSCLEGFNTTIFTYGQTGTGKTHTMLGHDIWALASECDSAAEVDGLHDDDGARGIIPRTMQWLFQKKDEITRQSGADMQVSVSYVEIYNEKVMDLLRPDAVLQNMGSPNGGGGGAGGSSTSGGGLDIREDKKTRGIVVPGLTETPVATADEVLQVLWRGAQNRAMAATDMNERSSRSHTILQVFVSQEFPDRPGVVRRSKVCLVDLAGSEKWRSHQLSKFSETRIKELTAINQSLSNLGNCISALMTPGRSHIPYRNSKLTRLLQDSLGGNTRTLFIVTLSPADTNAEESISTMQFADRAMRVQVYATVNEELVGANDKEMLRRYEAEIARLKTLLKACMAKSGMSEQQITAANDGNADGSLTFGLDLDTAKELEDLRTENGQLLKQVTHLQDRLHEEQEEKNRILEAIYGDMRDGEDDDDDMDDEDDENLDEEARERKRQRKREAEEQLSGALGLNLAEIRKLGDDPRVQMRILTAQRSILESKSDELRAAEEAQTARWEWLDRYHEWLRSLPVNDESGLGGGDDDSKSDSMGGTPTPFSAPSGEAGGVSVLDRLCMMETSVVLQADELKRTKRLFLQRQSELSSNLQEVTDQLREKQSELLRAQMDAVSAGGPPPKSRIPRRAPGSAASIPSTTHASAMQAPPAPLSRPSPTQAATQAALAAAATLPPVPGSPAAAEVAESMAANAAKKASSTTPRKPPQPAGPPPAHVLRKKPPEPAKPPPHMVAGKRGPSPAAPAGRKPGPAGGAGPTKAVSGKPKPRPARVPEPELEPERGPELEPEPTVDGAQRAALRVAEQRRLQRKKDAEQKREAAAEASSRRGASRPAASAASNGSSAAAGAAGATAPSVASGSFSRPFAGARRGASANQQQSQQTPGGVRPRSARSSRAAVAAATAAAGGGSGDDNFGEDMIVEQLRQALETPEQAAIIDEIEALNQAEKHRLERQNSRQSAEDEGEEVEYIAPLGTRSPRTTASMIASPGHPSTLSANTSASVSASASSPSTKASSPLSHVLENNANALRNGMAVAEQARARLHNPNPLVENEPMPPSMEHHMQAHADEVRRLRSKLAAKHVVADDRAPPVESSLGDDGRAGGGALSANSALSRVLARQGSTDRDGAGRGSGASEFHQLLAGGDDDDDVVVPAPVVKKKKKKKKPKHVWREFLDPNTGAAYFHNRVTGVTQWHRPTEEEMAELVQPEPDG